jgi:Tol biopolymer transport system component
MNFRQRKTAGAGATIASLLVAGTLIFNALPVFAVEFAHPAFKRVWDRTDSLVASLQVSRTWFWGPEPRAAAQEQYVDAPTGTGTRLVQYFDKSRMEINDPNGDQNSVFFVTNGLLTIELISGQMQIGNNAFINRYSANIPISGDTDDANAPTYSSFLGVSNSRRGDHPQPNRVGQFATATINRAGQVGDDPQKANTPGTKISFFEGATKHNIPDIFWQFLNASGPISQTGQIVNARLIDPWFYASGFPISDPYWSRVKIRGEVQDVMIQAFERRVLTYVPTNVPGFQVEMGNIGLHYYDWRYRDAGKPPGGGGSATTTPPVPITTTVTLTPAVTRTGTPPTGTPSVTPTPNVITQGLVAFASNRNGNYEIWVARGDGSQEKNLTNRPNADDDYPAWSPDGTKLAFVSNRDGNDEIYVMNSDGTGVTRLTNEGQQDTQPQWSPDGAKLVFVSKRFGGQPDIWTMNANGTEPRQLTIDVANDTDPSWGANGRIIFTSKRSGTAQLYTINPDGSNLIGPITNQGESFLAKWNTAANRIVFVSNRDGNNEIYTMRQGGEEQTRLTNNTWADWDPSYAPDNSRIVFAATPLDPANLDLYIMGIDGSNVTRITIAANNDKHPSWKVSR